MSKLFKRLLALAFTTLLSTSIAFAAAPTLAKKDFAEVFTQGCTIGDPTTSGIPVTTVGHSR